MKKYFSIALVLILLLSTISAAFAAGFDPITVQIPVEGTGTYKLTDLGDNTSETLEVNGSGAFSRTFSKRGSHSYDLVSENFGQLEEYSVQIVIDDDGNENLVSAIAIKNKATGAKTQSAAFTQATIVCENDPPVKKVVNGNDACTAAFTVQMIAADASYPMPEGSSNGVKTATVVGADEFEFGTITFTEAGTYDYTFQEVNDGVPGYVYDENTYGVRYVVSEVGNSALTSERTFLKNGQPVDGIEFISITNEYHAPVEDTPQITKVLTGIDNSSEVFKVTMTPKTANAPMPSVGTSGSQTAEVTGSGEFNFGTLTFTEPGIFEYEFKEINNGTENYQYDPNTYKIKYDISVGPDYALTAAKSFFVNGVQDDTMTSIVITNSYSEDPQPVQEIPQVVKVVSGKDDCDDVFEITMTPKTAGAPMPTAGSSESQKSEVTGSGAVNFGMLSFAQPGIYEYEFKEIDGGLANYTYDSNTYGIKYDVSLGAANEYVVDTTFLVNGQEDDSLTQITITNTYEAPNIEPIQEIPQVTKVLNGIDNSTVEFEAVMTAKTQNAPMPDGSENGVKKVTVTGSGTFNFGTITFTEPGIYEYEFTETDGGVKNYTYDTNVYGLKYNVTLNNDNELICEKEFSVNGREGADMALINFINSYSESGQETPQDPDPIQVSPQVKKVVEGTENSSVEFTAIMEAVQDSYPMPEGSENGTKKATVTGSGTFNFGSVTFAEPGVYEYNFKEEKGEAEGYAYDESVYTIRYNVTKNNDEQLSVETVYLSGDDVLSETTAVTFVNTFTPTTQEVPEEDPKPVTVVPLIAKTVTGIDNCQETFQVQMSTLDMNNPMPEDSVNGVKKATVKGGGQFNFGSIQFKEPGIYEYEFREINTGAAGYTYDTSIYIVRFTVKANDANELFAVMQIIKNNTVINNAVQVVFRNKYVKPADTTTTPTETGTPTSTTTPTPTTSVTPTPYVNTNGSTQTQQQQVGKTGDDGHILTYMMAFLVSLVALSATIYFMKKKKKAQE